MASSSPKKEGVKSLEIEDFNKLYTFIQDCFGNIDNFFGMSSNIFNENRNNGFISNNGILKIIRKILDYDIENEYYNILFIQKILPLHLNRHYEKINSSLKPIFVNNLKNTLDNDIKWYIKEEIISSEGDNQLDKKMNILTMILIQTINKMIINKKINLNYSPARYIIRTIFSVIKNLVFINVNDEMNMLMIYENKPQLSRKEMVYIGRNAFLRSAWNLYISLIYSYEKQKLYNSEVQIDDDKLLMIYNQILNYLNSKNDDIKMIIETNNPKKSIYLKIISEYKNKLGVISMALSCFYIYKMYSNIFNEYENQLIRNIVFDPWMWHINKNELHKSVHNDAVFNKINILDREIMFEESKQLHSFRATRTYGIPLPLRYWQYDDPQDSCAVTKTETLLGIIIKDVSVAFGKYDSYLRDLSKTDTMILDLKNLLYVKMSDLRNILNQEINRFLQIEQNNDIPSIQDRIISVYIDDIDKEKVISSNRNIWIRLRGKSQPLFVKLDRELFLNEEKQSDEATLMKYDNDVNQQIKKMVIFDNLQSDIFVAQSILRYLESIFQKFFPEARSI